MLVIFQFIKSVTNILNRSPISQTCHQHIWSPLETLQHRCYRPLHIQFEFTHTVLSHTEFSLYGAKDVINISFADISSSEISLFHLRISKHDIFRENFGETKLTKGNIEHALRQMVF